MADRITIELSGDVILDGAKKIPLDARGAALFPYFAIRAGKLVKDEEISAILRHRRNGGSMNGVMEAMEAVKRAFGVHGLASCWKRKLAVGWIYTPPAISFAGHGREDERSEPAEPITRRLRRGGFDFPMPNFSLITRG